MMKPGEGKLRYYMSHQKNILLDVVARLALAR